MSHPSRITQHFATFPGPLLYSRIQAHPGACLMVPDPVCRFQVLLFSGSFVVVCPRTRSSAAPTTFFFPSSLLLCLFQGGKRRTQKTRSRGGSRMSDGHPQPRYMCEQCGDMEADLKWSVKASRACARSTPWPNLPTPGKPTSSSLIPNTGLLCFP